jgi:hypothetical protein
MGSQTSSTSSPTQVPNADAWDQQELVYEKSSSDETDRTFREKWEERTPEPHVSGPATDQRSTFLRLPKDVRNIIYSYALAVEEGYYSWSGVSHGLVCVADNNINNTPKLCNLTYMQSDDQRFLEDYLTEDHNLLKPFIARKMDASRIEVCQLKYVCKQLYHETRGLTLKINAGKKIIFHGTRTEGNTGLASLLSRYPGRVSGIANFVDFYGKCSPEQQKHIRDADIIELPLDDERPKILGPSFIHSQLDRNCAPAAVVPRTWVEHIIALKLREVLKPRK